MFYGCQCTFDGKSCTEFDLMLYDFASTRQGDVDFTSPGQMLTDHIPGRYDTYMYGIDQNKPLTYQLVLCANSSRANTGTFFTRTEIANIASWLCGHSTWKWFTIDDQSDMQQYRYRCVISEMKLLTHGAVPWAFAFTVTCDSPYAYLEQTSDTYTSTTDGIAVQLTNPSSLHGIYYPRMSITLRGRSVLIRNATTNQTLELTDVPNTITSVEIDGSHQTLVTTPTAINLYPYFNKEFVGLASGTNSVVMVGEFDVIFSSLFPVDIGA